MNKALGVVAATAALAVVGACGTPAAPPPPPDPYQPAAGQVAALQTPMDMTLADGRRIHVTMLQGSTTTDPCETAADMALARQMLQGRDVTITPPVTRDTPSVVPAGALQVDLRTGDGRDYGTLFDPARAENRLAECSEPPPAPVQTSSPVSSSPGSDADIDVDRDSNMPDGALTGGYCARKWWC